MMIKGLKQGRDIKRPMPVTPAELNFGRIPEGWYIGRDFLVDKVVYDHKNGCCRKLPILIVTNEVIDYDSATVRINYSGQCACGGWCTSGQRTAQEALDQYDRMTYREMHHLPSEYDSALVRGKLDMATVREEVLLR